MHRRVGGQKFQALTIEQRLMLHHRPVSALGEHDHFHVGAIFGQREQAAVGHHHVIGSPECQHRALQLAQALGLAPDFVMPAFEDPWKILRDESNLPHNIDPLDEDLKSPAVREKLQELGFDVVASSPEAYAKLIRDEIVRWSTVVRDQGIKVD